MELVGNHFKGGKKLAPDAPYPSVDAERVSTLLSACPAFSATPMANLPELASSSGLDALWVKDETARMGLGSFKALGAAYVIATMAAEKDKLPTNRTLEGMVFATASAGNHGLSVAAGARVFGAKSAIYLANAVPESFAQRLRDMGAMVVRHGVDYAESLTAAMSAADENGWTLLSDTSWPGYTDIPFRLMEGYLQMAAEAVEQSPRVPTHIMLQAGVGGLASAVAAFARKSWGDEPKIIVVEPTNAPALQASIKAGKSVYADGPESSMGRLDCKEPSLIALNGLAHDADAFLTLDDSQVEATLPALAEHGISTSPSGAAGIAAALLPESQEILGLNANSRVLTFASECEA